MRVVTIQHDPLVKGSHVKAWARDRRFNHLNVRLDRDEPFPSISEFDCLVLLGGRMAIHDHDQYPWLEKEKDFIDRCLHGGKAVVGLCLGGQLIASVLGASITRNPYPEIGWHTVALRPEARWSPHLRDWPERFSAFNWHGDTFSLPDGAVHIAQSEACPHHGFVYGDRVIGMQWHPEFSASDIERLLDNCVEGLPGGPYVQPAIEIRNRLNEADRGRELLFSLFDSFSDLF